MRAIETAFWGTLLKDLELKTSATGKQYCHFGCAVITGKADNGKDASQYIRVACFGDTAAILVARAKKGDRVYVEGQLTMTQWNAADGEVRHGLNVAAWKCERVGNIGRHRERKGHGEEPGPARLPGMVDSRPPASYRAGPSAAPSQYGDGFDERDGDPLPF